MKVYTPVYKCRRCGLFKVSKNEASLSISFNIRNKMEHICCENNPQERGLMDLVGWDIAEETSVEKL
jgi:hypothetical protein